MTSKNEMLAIVKIAKEFRKKKDAGLFSTYRNAYKAAVISSNIDGLTIEKLEQNYYHYKRKNKINKNQSSNSVSIPIMITQEMRMRLKGLKYHMSDIRNLTPKQAHDIIRNQIVNKNPSQNHARNQ